MTHDTVQDKKLLRNLPIIKILNTQLICAQSDIVFSVSRAHAHTYNDIVIPANYTCSNTSLIRKKPDRCNKETLRKTPTGRNSCVGGPTN